MKRTLPLVLSEFLRSRDISITDTGDAYSTEKKLSGLKLKNTPYLRISLSHCSCGGGLRDEIGSKPPVSVSREDEAANTTVTLAFRPAL
jgi:hypothetical protein